MLWLQAVEHLNVRYTMTSLKEIEANIKEEFQENLHQNIFTGNCFISPILIACSESGSSINEHCLIVGEASLIIGRQINQQTTTIPS